MGFLWRAIAFSGLMLLLGTVSYAIDMSVAGEKTQLRGDLILEAGKVLKTLVIVEHDTQRFKEAHATFLRRLEEAGHALSFDSFTNFKTKLFWNRVPQFRNVILAVPYLTRNDARGLKIAELLRLYDDHGVNILILGLGAPGSLNAEIAKECEMFYAENVGSVADFHSYATSSALQRYILTNDTAVVGPVFSRAYAVAYRGRAHLLKLPNRLVTPILHGSPTTYVPDDSGTSARLNSGSAVHLVSAMQGRNGARVTLSGSTSICTDAVYTLNPDNSEFCHELALWTFMRRGVIDWINLRHYLSEKEANASSSAEEAVGLYRSGDEITVALDLFELKDNRWVPFKTHTMQVEYVMLDPYIRAFMDTSDDPEDPRHHVTFKTPDTYGVFKLRIAYAPKGYSRIFIETLAPLRNFRHNDYPRYLTAALPYYVSVLAGMLLACVFINLLLYHEQPTSKFSFPGVNLLLGSRTEQDGKTAIRHSCSTAATPAAREPGVTKPALL